MSCEGVGILPPPEMPSENIFIAEPGKSGSGNTMKLCARSDRGSERGEMGVRVTLCSLRRRFECDGV